MEPQFQLQVCQVQSEIEEVAFFRLAEAAPYYGCVQREELGGPERVAARKGNPVMPWRAPANQSVEEGAVLGFIEILP